ncbi:MAG: transglutaminase family protein [Candidatus Methylacidiphilales bacterium]
MRLSVLHRTVYTYLQPVTDSVNEARLQPRTDPFQTCLEFHFHTVPSSSANIFQDFYRNTVHVFEVAEPHRKLLIESRSLVETHAPPLPPEDRVIPFDLLKRSAWDMACYEFLQATEFVSCDVAAWRLAVDLAPDRRDVRETALSLMRGVHREFEYCQESTQVHTHMSEVLQFRRGVCQDFAHVYLGLCRSLGIPARYVSGYLFTNPGPGALRGTEASHAWCEVHLPGWGWLGLDPTNNQPVDERYIRVALGRDYHDVPPTRGTYRGPDLREMQVDVSVRQADDGGSVRG